MTGDGSGEAVLAELRALVETSGDIDFTACYRAVARADFARLRAGIIDAVTWALLAHALNLKHAGQVRADLLRIKNEVREWLAWLEVVAPELAPKLEDLPRLTEQGLTRLTEEFPRIGRPRMLAFEIFIRALAPGYEAATGKHASYRGRFAALVEAVLPALKRMAKCSGRDLTAPNSAEARGQFIFSRHRPRPPSE